MTDLTLFLLLCISFLCINTRTQIQRNFGAWVMVIILVLLFGLRHYTVGVDSQNYAFHYETLQNLGVFETGFIWFMKGLHTISSRYTCLFLTTAAIFWSGLVFFYKKYTLSYWLAIFLYCALGAVNDVGNNGIRQGMAIVMFVLAIPFALQKQWLRYFALLIVAFLFHRSVVFVFPVYFIAQVKFKLWTLLPITGLVIIGLIEAENITNYFFPDYDRYFLKTVEISMGSIVQKLVITGFAVIPLYHRYTKHLDNENPNLNNLLLWLIPLYLLCLWGGVLFMAGRPFIRLSWYLFPLVFLNFTNYLDTQTIKFRWVVTYASVALIFFYRLGVYWLSNTSSQADLIYYYKFFWQ